MWKHSTQNRHENHMRGNGSPGRRKAGAFSHFPRSTNNCPEYEVLIQGAACPHGFCWRSWLKKLRCVEFVRDRWGFDSCFSHHPFLLLDRCPILREKTYRGTHPTHYSRDDQVNRTAHKHTSKNRRSGSRGSFRCSCCCISFHQSATDLETHVVS